MTKRFTRTLLLVLVGVLIGTLAHAQYTYQTIDAPQGAHGTRVSGLTDGGNLSGTYWDANGVERGWMYVARTNRFQAVTQRGAPALLIDEHTPSMRFVGRMVTPGGSRAFTKYGRQFAELNIPSDVQTCSITPASWIVCSVIEVGTERAYGVFYDLSLHQVMALIEIPGTLGTMAQGVNGMNDVVGAYVDPMTQTLRGYLRYGFPREGVVSGEIVPIDAPCVGETVVEDVNDDGLMAVVCANDQDGSILSYLFDGVTWQEIAVPEAMATLVRRVNNLGQAAGTYWDADWQVHGFVARPGQAMAAQ